MSHHLAGQPSSQVLESLRHLPSVEELASQVDDHPHPIRVSAARLEVDLARQRILAGTDPPSLDALQRAVARRAEDLAGASLRRVINATGVVLHTNLGRAPLAEAAIKQVAEVARGYSNLEYDLDTGERGTRTSHIEPLLREVSGAEAALAVNNNAAAVTLALAATAVAQDVIVSRGQLVEIGGSFRIPEILEQSGARLVEVGTTNRTQLADYERAIGSDTAAILRVHQSNFRTVGFTEEVGLNELGVLARARKVALIDDLGSGALEQIGDEPRLPESVAAGADLVCSSADKLLGGPQAGIIVGRTEAVDRCRHHPLARAFRLDKLQLAALETTLRMHQTGDRSAIPALGMLAAPEEELNRRAVRMAELIGGAASVIRGTARPGGGTLPLLELEGPACAIDPDPGTADQLVDALRHANPPVIVRVVREQVILDPRTMTDEDAEMAARAARDIVA